jgi:tetratricopeptide (TPR) repeat protein
LDPTRIADLRRRLQADPTSIAFAQLAEEYRRAGQLDEAVAVCRDGLLRHQGYLSARITLGRALAEQGEAADAEHEFELVLRSAPDNLAAIRGLGEICQKRGELDRALAYYRRAMTLTRYDPELDETVKAIAEALGGRGTTQADGLSFEQASQELMDAAAKVPAAPARVDFDALLRSLGHEPDAPAPPIVEAWLSPDPTAALQAPVPPPALEPTSAVPPLEIGTDLLAKLEADLRQLERQPPPTIPHTAPRRDAAEAAIAELERWLTAIAVRRRALAKRR